MLLPSWMMAAIVPTSRSRRKSSSFFFPQQQQQQQSMITFLIALILLASFQSVQADDKVICELLAPSDRTGLSLLFKSSPYLSLPFPSRPPKLILHHLSWNLFTRNAHAHTVTKEVAYCSTGRAVNTDRFDIRYYPWVHSYKLCT